MSLRPVDEVLRDLDPDIDKALGKMALLLQASMQEVLSQPGRGRIYQRGKGVVHRASRPFDPPAPDAGNLKRSVEVERIGERSWRLSVVANYAIFLQFGTARMQPRPFMLEGIRLAESRLRTQFAVTLRTPNPRGGRR